MQIRPNRTHIRATVVNKEFTGSKMSLEIVLIELKPPGAFPAFLWVGKLLRASCHDADVFEQLEAGTIIEAEIEITGGPEHQGFVLHNISTQQNSEQE